MTAHPYPQPAGAPGEASAPRRRGSAGRILIVTGIVIALLSVLLGAVLAVLGFRDLFGGLAQNEVLPGGQGVITLEAGEQRSLYTQEGTPAPECTVLDPTGSEPAEGGIRSSTVTVDGASWVSFENFRATSAGEYEISCSTTVLVGPPVSIGGIFAGVGGIVAAGTGGGLGVLLIIIGAVLHVALKPKD